MLNKNDAISQWTFKFLIDSEIRNQTFDCLKQVQTSSDLHIRYYICKTLQNGTNLFHYLLSSIFHLAYFLHNTRCLLENGPACISLKAKKVLSKENELAGYLGHAPFSSDVSRQKHRSRLHHSPRPRRDERVGVGEERKLVRLLQQHKHNNSWRTIYIWTNQIVEKVLCLQMS